MTYCLAIRVKAGLVFCSDSLTSAGVDQVSTYSKMHRFALGPDRVAVVLTAGNLGTTQAVLARVRRDLDDPAAHSLRTVASIDEAADYIGAISREVQARHGEDKTFEASFLVGGQIRGQEPEVALVYPQGNHITTSPDTPYLQIGESKYGKPVLDRILTPDTSLETAALCALVSMDSTMRSNLTVGPPIELLVYERDSFSLDRHYRFDADSDYLRELKRAWDSGLKKAFSDLPPIRWSQAWDRSPDAPGASSPEPAG